MIKRYEFWQPRLFETPFYFWLGMQCLLKRIGIRTLAKANFALNHGEIGLGSKYESHQAFDERYFLPTAFIASKLTDSEKTRVIQAFAAQQGYPLILKSNLGCVGKGILKVASDEEASSSITHLVGDYMVQKFTPFDTEYGVFYTRHKAKPCITGINRKHFPCVTGNGQDSLLTLAQNHYRYNDHWHAFLQNHDTNRVLEKGEVVQLSFIGSHTLGCRFTDESHRLTPELEAAVFEIFEQQPGYNFGRIDIKAKNPESFFNGEFVLIEINGVASLPTHMFDPKYTLLEAYQIFFQHAQLLATIAREHKDAPMELLPLREIIKRTGESQTSLNSAHKQLMKSR